MKNEGKNVCAVCGEKAGFGHIKSKDKKLICSDCKKRALSYVTQAELSGMNADEYYPVFKKIEDCEALALEFHETVSVENYLKIDESAKKWYVPKEKKTPVIHGYDEVLEYELLQNGNSVTKGGLGRAAAGALLFGGFGAVVGASTGKKRSQSTVSRLQLKITLKSMERPVEYIDFITGGDLKTSGSAYKAIEKNAQKCLSFFQIMTIGKGSQQQTSSTADEIKRFKELLDIGAITQEEFDEKKRQLLGM